LIHSNQALDVVLFVAVLIPSIVLHEVAHGWVASRFGDDTARRAGRLTLNPVGHLDPIGSLVAPALLAVSGLPVWGWAKPVPVNPAAFRRPTETMAVVALAGPATNLLIALLLGVVLAVEVVASPICDRLATFADAPGLLCLGGGELAVTGGLGARVLLAAILVNIALAVFNMLPIPPLDGSRLLPLVLPERARAVYHRFAPYGFLILIMLIFVFRGSLRFVSAVIGWIMRGFLG
jgi:Zn-dependent protease